MKETMTVALVFLLLAACGEETAVELPYPATVDVSPETAEFTAFRGTVRLTATVRDQDGNVMDTVGVKWSSEDADVAEVGATGVVTALGTGVVEIAATAGAASGEATVTVRLPQRDALVRFYESLDGDSWPENGNWTTKTELNTWYGIETDGGGNVTAVVLISNNLSGELPREIAILEHLVDLNLAFNEGISGIIPSEIGELKKLRSLQLHHNLLTGPVPPEIANLTDLRVLDLHHNPLTGPVPDWLGDLPDLTWLSLWGTELNGPLPASLGNLRHLEGLFLHHATKLRGPLPRSLMNLNLDWFWWQDTGLCSPPDEEFRNWLRTIENRMGSGVCES